MSFLISLLTIIGLIVFGVLLLWIAEFALVFYMAITGLFDERDD